MIEKKNYYTVRTVVEMLSDKISKITLLSGWQIIPYTIGSHFDESMYGRKAVTGITFDGKDGCTLDVILA